MAELAVTFAQKDENIMSEEIITIMEDVCRLCCSSKYVNNNIFDDENALFLKMSLYLPIKIFKNDRLPQKVCDKCSCKVNDFYQFCNEAIEVQNRLRSIIFNISPEKNDSSDITRIKENTSPPVQIHCEQSTQTDDMLQQQEYITNATVDIKQEQTSPSIKNEEVILDTDNVAEHYSDTSEDVSLVTLKKKKRNKQLNGVEKKSKKKSKLKEWEVLINTLPEDTEFSLEDKSNILEQLPQNIKAKSEHDVDINVVKKEVNTSDIYNCCICLSQCYNKTEMLRHYRQHAEKFPLPEVPPPPDPELPGPHRCMRCNKEVVIEQWSGHWLQHWSRDRRPYRCSLCEKSYSDHHQILKHGLTHKYEEGSETGVVEQTQARYLCDMCPERFVYMRYLLAHRTRSHPEHVARPLTFRCAICTRDFAHLNSLRRHIRAHSGERNHLCNVCGKALTSREHLKFHINIHTGYKPNVCKTCGKGFVKKCNLTLHERVHSGEKPHVCSHCGKAFSQRSTLVIHERYHSGARPYVCELCGRGFVAKGLLSMHLKNTCV